MSQITSIKQQKDKNRVNVYLDDKFGFGIDLDNFVLLNLRVNQELTEEEVEKIIKKAEFQKTLDKLLKWAMGRLHSEKEVREYLRRRKVSEVIWKDLFAKLKYLDLLDDEKFARAFVESRNTFKPKPKRILIQELRFKGVSKEIIDEVLGETKIDEEKIARELLISRSAHWERIEKKKRKEKMTYYLVSKGFTFELVKKVITAYNSKEDA